MLNPKKNIAVIGSGYWGKNLVRNFHKLGALHTICDASADTLQSFSKQYPDVSTCRDYTKLADDTEIRGVVIALPAALHYASAKFFLERGKDVFVEKPLSLNYSEAEELVKIADEKKSVLMVGHLLNYHPAVMKIKEMVRSGEIGKLRYIYSNRLNYGKFRTEENILWSFAPHDISVILSLVGEEPKAVYAVGEHYLNEDVEDTTISYLSFRNHVSAHIYVSWLHPFKEQRLVIIGSDKMLVFDDAAEKKENKLIVYAHKVKWTVTRPEPLKGESTPIEFDYEAEPLENECRAFLESMEKNKNPLTDGREGLRVLKVLDSLQRSIQGNGEKIFLQTEKEKVF